MQNIFSENVKVIDGQAELSIIPEIILNFGKVLITEYDGGDIGYNHDIFAKASRAFDNVVNINGYFETPNVKIIEVQIEYATKFPIVVVE
jgi:hypothetical protein